MLWAVAAGSDPNNRAGTMLMAKAPPMMLIKYRAPALLASFIRPPEGAGPIWPDSTVVAGITAIDSDSQLMSGCCRGRGDSGWKPKCPLKAIGRLRPRDLRMCTPSERRRLSPKRLSCHTEDRSCIGERLLGHELADSYIHARE